MIKANTVLNAKDSYVKAQLKSAAIKHLRVTGKLTEIEEAYDTITVKVGKLRSLTDNVTVEVRNNPNPFSDPGAFAWSSRYKKNYTINKKHLIKL